MKDEINMVSACCGAHYYSHHLVLFCNQCGKECQIKRGDVQTMDTITPYTGLAADMRAASEPAVGFLHQGGASDTEPTEPGGDVKEAKRKVVDKQTQR